MASVNNFKEHEFLINQLLQQDSQHRQWYVSVKEINQGLWINDAQNNTLLKDIGYSSLLENNSTVNGDDVAYT